MEKSKVKGRVVYHDKNLSALAISNLAGVVLKDLKVEQDKNPIADRPEFLKTELKIGSKIIRGELAIMDYIAATANAINGGPTIYLQG